MRGGLGPGGVSSLVPSCHIEMTLVQSGRKASRVRGTNTGTAADAVLTSRQQPSNTPRTTPPPAHSHPSFALHRLSAHRRPRTHAAAPSTTTPATAGGGRAHDRLLSLQRDSFLSEHTPHHPNRVNPLPGFPVDHCICIGTRPPSRRTPLCTATPSYFSVSCMHSKQLSLDCLTRALTITHNVALFINPGALCHKHQQQVPASVCRRQRCPRRPTETHFRHPDPNAKQTKSRASSTLYLTSHYVISRSFSDVFVNQDSLPTITSIRLQLTGAFTLQLTWALTLQLTSTFTRASLGLFTLTCNHASLRLSLEPRFDLYLSLTLMFTRASLRPLPPGSLYAFP